MNEPTPTLREKIEEILVASVGDGDREVQSQDVDCLLTLIQQEKERERERIVEKIEEIEVDGWNHAKRIENLANDLSERLNSSTNEES